MLDPEEKKSVQEDYQSWVDVQEKRKDLNKEVKDVIANASKIFDVKPATVGKLFTSLRKKEKSQVDEIEELSDLAKQMDA